MKRILQWSVAILMLLFSVLVAVYPILSNYYSNQDVDKEVVQYLDYVAQPPANKYESVIKKAREYNKNLLQNPVKKADPFTKKPEAPVDYYNQLKVDSTDVMATVKIPRINVNLPIYHGTSDEVLKKGVGHLSASSLPVGGFGTHTALSAHTGSSSLKLFSDLDRLVINDIFYINCLGEEMAYQVNQIKTVLPTDTSLLEIDPDEDYVTLITCTPFGVNTHRLLVRGTRVDLKEAKQITTNVETAKSTWTIEYFKAALLGVFVMFLILLVYIIVRFIVRLCKKNKCKSVKAEESKINE